MPAHLQAPNGSFEYNPEWTPSRRSFSSRSSSSPVCTPPGCPKITLSREPTSYERIIILQSGFNTMVPNSLFAAIRAGDLQATRKLIQGNEDIDINTRYDGSCNRTLLHHACIYGELEIVKYLIQAKNANINSVDGDGWTPLFQTCFRDDFTCSTKEERAKIVEFLLMNGADVNIRTSTNCTALQRACLWGSTACIQRLLNHGANINSADTYGDTPLHYACCENPQINVIKFLLANNADRHTKNRLGGRPIDALREHGLEEVFESYDKWPLAVDNMHATTTHKKVSTGVMVGLNPCLSQHQHALAAKTVLLVRQLPVHEVAFEILGFLTPAAVEKIFLPTV